MADADPHVARIKAAPERVDHRLGRVAEQRGLAKVGDRLSVLPLVHGEEPQRPLTVRALRVSAESQYARIVELVRSAQASKAPLQRLADEGKRAKFIYTIPTVQNPTGTILPEARRAEMLKLADEYGVPIFEEHYDGEIYMSTMWDIREMLNRMYPEATEFKRPRPSDGQAQKPITKGTHIFERIFLGSMYILGTTSPDTLVKSRDAMILADQMLYSTDTTDATAPGRHRATDRARPHPRRAPGAEPGHGALGQRGNPAPPAITASITLLSPMNPAANGVAGGRARSWLKAVRRLAAANVLSWSYFRPFWSFRWTLHSFPACNAKAISSEGSSPARMAWAVSIN